MDVYSPHYNKQKISTILNKHKHKHKHKHSKNKLMVYAYMLNISLSIVNVLLLFVYSIGVYPSVYRRCVSITLTVYTFFLLMAVVEDVSSTCWSLAVSEPTTIRCSVIRGRAGSADRRP